MSKDTNQKLDIALKWSFRILSVISLLIIGVTILIFGLQPLNANEGVTTRLSTEVISLLMVSVIGGLTITGGKAHVDIKDEKIEK